MILKLQMTTELPNLSAAFILTCCGTTFAAYCPFGALNVASHLYILQKKINLMVNHWHNSSLYSHPGTHFPRLSLWDRWKNTWGNCLWERNMKETFLSFFLEASFSDYVSINVLFKFWLTRRNRINAFKMAPIVLVPLLLLNLSPAKKDPDSQEDFSCKNLAYSIQRDGRSL